MIRTSSAVLLASARLPRASTGPVRSGAPKRARACSAIRQRGQEGADGGAAERRLEQGFEQAGLAPQAVQRHIQPHRAVAGAKIADDRQRGLGLVGIGQALIVHQVGIAEDIDGVLALAHLDQHRDAVFLQPFGIGIVQEQLCLGLTGEILQLLDVAGDTLRQAGHAGIDHWHQAAEIAGRLLQGKLGDRLQHVGDFLVRPGARLHHPVGPQRHRHGDPFGRDDQHRALFVIVFPVRPGGEDGGSEDGQAWRLFAGGDSAIDGCGNARQLHQPLEARKPDGRARHRIAVIGDVTAQVRGIGEQHQQDDGRGRADQEQQQRHALALRGVFMPPSARCRAA